MNIKQRIILLEQDIQELRKKYLSSSIAMRRELEKKANQKKAEIGVLERVLEKRAQKDLFGNIRQS